MASIETAKAKAAAERSFRVMVMHNNKTCNLCRVGKEKIAKRRLEIEGTIKQEVQKRAERAAEKRRHDKMVKDIGNDIINRRDIYSGKPEKKEKAKPVTAPV